ncbi:MAG: PA2779 family protein [Moraxellaceae bacterium]|nr:PA2779 family protein [Moraxellaceae bacterium]
MTGKTGFKTTAVVLLLSMGMSSLPAQALMLSTEEATATAATATMSSANAERAALQDMLTRADVQAGLARYGVDAAQAADRVAAMSDAEVASMHGRLGEMPAGGSVIGVVVFVFVLLLVTDILGLTKVFPFTRSMR